MKKNIKKFLQVLFWFCIWAFLSVTFSYWSNTWLIWSIFKFNADKSALLITNEAFNSNSISGWVLKDYTVLNEKIATNINASKFSTWTIKSENIPSSVLNNAWNTKALSWALAEEIITYDDTKIPTSKAVYDKIKDFLNCPATTSSDYTTVLMQDWEIKSFQKPVTISNWSYKKTQSFVCNAWVLKTNWTENISELYCNPGYWANWTTNSCSEVGVWYYSTWWTTRSVCANALTSNSSYSWTTNTASSCNWWCNIKYVWYSGTCVLDCASASIWSYCWNSTHWYYWYKATGSLVITSSLWSSLYSSSSSLCTSYSGWWYSNWRLPTSDELVLIKTNYPYSISSNASWVWTSTTASVVIWSQQYCARQESWTCQARSSYPIYWTAYYFVYINWLSSTTSTSSSYVVKCVRSI